MKRITIFIIAAAGLCGCPHELSSNDIQRQQQETQLKDLAAKTGMPAIVNGRERALLKDIYELRDQAGLVTYTYIVDLNGKLVFLGQSIGYGIPAATQFTAPTSMQRWMIPVSADRDSVYGVGQLPQADPNGLFSPASAEGTWVMLKDPHGDQVKPVYVEPRIIVSPFRLE